MYILNVYYIQNLYSVYTKVFMKYEFIVIFFCVRTTNKKMCTHFFLFVISFPINYN